MKQDFARWQTYFYTGLVVMLPAVIAITIVAWLFGAISSITDRLLFFLHWLPAGGEEWVYKVDAAGNLLQPLQVKWWWSLAALFITIFFIGLIGRMTRYYIGKKILELIDWFILRVPLLNRIYAAVKQVNEALTKKNQSSFKQVVLVEFPGRGLQSIGFLTGESHVEISEVMDQEMVSVFVSTTPNPTSGFLVFIPRDKVRKLKMSVADGVKYIISLGSVAPAPVGPAGQQAPVLTPEQVRKLATDSGVETREMTVEKKPEPKPE